MSNFDFVNNPVTRYIVVSGNPVDGFEFAGPFVEHEDALIFAESPEFEEWSGDTTWWIAKMEGPL